MRAKKFICCLLAMVLFAGVSFISCGNSSKAKADSEAAVGSGEDFKSFWISLLPVRHSNIPVSSFR